MLHITVPATELWDESKEEFISTKEQILALEHSLVSISKWESKWCKPFMSIREKTPEEIIDYVRCMTKTQNVDPNVYLCLTRENISQINKYIEAPMTATRFKEEQKGKSRGTQVTSELIYFWMVSFNIPVEFQKWHLNRLLTLIRVCEAKSHKPKHMSRGEVMRQNAALNASRRKRLKSRG